MFYSPGEAGFPGVKGFKGAKGGYGETGPKGLTGMAGNPGLTGRLFCESGQNIFILTLHKSPSNQAKGFNNFLSTNIFKNMNRIKQYC